MENNSQIETNKNPLENKKNIQLIVFLAIQFVIVAVILLLILFWGSKPAADISYTVTFDLDGGTLVSGDLVQTVKSGESAVPPKATKEGAYLAEWSDSYKNITKDIKISAVWEYETTAGLQFETYGNYYIISGSYEGLSGNVYIGSAIDDVPILGIKAEAFKNRENITGVYISEGVVSIEDSAFEGCTRLETIIIPSSVKMIGDGILKDCIGLENLSISFIGNNSYMWDQTSMSMSYLFGVEDNSLIPNSLKNLTITSDFRIPAHSLRDCEYIENIKITGNVNTIEEYAFAYCTGLKTIELPESLKTIGDKAFICTGLESVVIPDGVEELPDACFANSFNLSSVTVGAEFKNMLATTFQNCPLLDNVTIPVENDFVVCVDNVLYIKEEGKTMEVIIPSTEYIDDDDYRKVLVTYRDLNGDLVGTEWVRVYEEPKTVIDGYTLDGSLYLDKDATELFESVVTEAVTLYGDFSEDIDS